MKRKWFDLAVPLTLLLGLMSCASVKQPTSDQGSQRATFAAKVFPEQKKFLYIDVPAADNGVSNLMMRAFMGDAISTKQLMSVMARGASTPTYVVVGSQDNGVAYSALKGALDGLKAESLPYLHLGLVGDPDQAEQLRPKIEALGSEYRVLASPR
jgi:hypothetical protein